MLYNRVGHLDASGNYVYTKNSDEAALYQLDDLNKITFSDKGVRIWNTIENLCNKSYKSIG